MAGSLRIKHVAAFRPHYSPLFLLIYRPVLLLLLLEAPWKGGKPNIRGANRKRGILGMSILRICVYYLVSFIPPDFWPVESISCNVRLSVCPPPAPSRCQKKLVTHIKNNIICKYFYVIIIRKNNPNMLVQVVHRYLQL